MKTSALRFNDDGIKLWDKYDMFFETKFILTFAELAFETEGLIITAKHT